MKTKLLLLLATGFAVPAGAVDSSASSAIPAAFPADRYQKMIEKSPFALATPVAAPVAADKGFAEGWYISGLAQLDGKNFVTVKSKDLSEQFSLFGDDETKGVKIQSVDWSPAIGKSTVMIQKDGQFAKLTFNEAEMQSAAPPPPQGNPAAMPGGIRPMNNPGIRPPAGNFPQPVGNAGVQQRQIIPRPTTQPVVSQPQAYPVTVPGGSKPGVVPAAPAPPGDGRRRIRMINTQPGQ